jgi:uncharacterized protein (UPF0210 family)
MFVMPDMPITPVSAPIRTITLGLAEPHPLSATTLQQASTILHDAHQRFADNGYEVQTLRISTRPLFDDLAWKSDTTIVRYVQELQRMLDEVYLSFCSLGTAQVTRPEFPLDRLNLIPELIGSTRAINMTVQLATQAHGLRFEAALPTARIIQRLAQETEEGFGNFRFAMLACMPPNGPFFPAAYADGSNNLTIGVQGPSIVAEVLRASHSETGTMPKLTQVTESIKEAISVYAAPLLRIGLEIAQKHELSFDGLDTSPAPMGEDSIVAAIEQCGYGLFGSSGTLALASAITAALKTVGVNKCGYCGLMLPVLEDAILGHRWNEGRVNVHTLLLYSAVCGTGLDTIPLAGDTPAATLANLLLDVAALALRLQKPLSARLFPVPHKGPGEMTTFTSPYLTNARIQ